MSENQPKKILSTLLVIGLVAAIIVAAFVAVEYQQQRNVLNLESKSINSLESVTFEQNSTISTLESTLASETAQIVAAQANIDAMSSTISSQNGVISGQSGMISDYSTNMASLTAYLNNEVASNLYNDYAIPLASGQKYNQTSALSFDGMVVFAEAFVPSGTHNTTYIQVCNSDILSTSGYGSSLPSPLNVGTFYCINQTELLENGTAVYVGWISVTSYSDLVTTLWNNLPNSGTVTFVANYVY